MGVPQRRERVFFIALRKDLAPKFMQQVDMFTELPKLELDFNEKEILYKDFKTGELGKKLTKETIEIWEQRIESDLDFASIHERLTGKLKRFQVKFIKDEKVPNTIAAGDDSIPVKFDLPYRICMNEVKMIGSFPLDYNFLNIKPNYLIGMSVPPLMTAKIVEQIYKQWLINL